MFQLLGLGCGSIQILYLACVAAAKRGLFFSKLLSSINSAQIVDVTAAAATKLYTLNNS